MKNLNLQLLFCVLLSGSIAAARSSFFDELFKEITEFESRIQSHLKQIKEVTYENVYKGQSVEVPNITIKENVENSSLELYVTPLNLVDKRCDAAVDLEANKLTVETNVGTMILQVRKQYVMADFNYQLHQKEDKDAQKIESIIQGHSGQSHMLAQQLLLDKAQIEYDLPQQALRVIIPFKKKATTKIPVTFKDAESIVEK